ncbi:MAG: YebC/PmpR family DNA-binding transcriptional regulator [Candidatus Glassbacteria bacterium]
MSGHSKWSTIKRKKATEDARRGRVFTKIIKEIMVAAREGGGDINANPRLRTAVDNAKAHNMPQENILRAIKKGTGELPGTHYENATYEGYGPGGVAIFVEVLTDNKNRTVSEIRHIFTKQGGNLGSSGCVAWMFTQKGQIYVDGSRYSEDATLDTALECGAEDFLSEEGHHTITTSPGELERVKECIISKGIEVDGAEVAMIPSSYVKVEGKDAEKLLKLMEALEEHDDVQRVASNFDMDEELLKSLS